MEPKYFKLIDVEATNDLLEIFDLDESSHYTKERTPKRGISYFKIYLDSKETQVFHDLIKDIDIYVPHIGIYLSDFMLMKVEPTNKVRDLINMFNVDQLFTPFLISPKLIRAKRALNKKEK